MGELLSDIQQSAETGEAARSVGVVTFNCEWRRTKSADAALVRSRIRDSGADVICLTEAYSDFFDGDGHTIASAAFDSNVDRHGRRKVLLWSRNPWTDVDTRGPCDLPEGRFAAGTTLTDLGEIRFVGVVIPYRFAGVRSGEPRRKVWELHLQYLEALGRFLPPEPRRSVLLGDFNQRLPRKYQSEAAFRSLSDNVLSSFRVATAGVLKPVGQQSIDHICHSADLISSGVEAIPNDRPGGGQISDHFGVRVTLSNNGL